MTEHHDVASHGPALPLLGSTQDGFLAKEQAQACWEYSDFQKIPD